MLPCLDTKYIADFKMAEEASYLQFLYRLQYASLSLFCSSFLTFCELFWNSERQNYETACNHDDDAAASTDADVSGSGEQGESSGGQGRWVRAVHQLPSGEAWSLESQPTVERALPSLLAAVCDQFAVREQDLLDVWLLMCLCCYA